MTEQDAIFVEDEDGRKSPLRGMRTPQIKNMELGAPPREFMPNNKVPYYVAATAALAITGSLAYNRFKKKDEEEVEIEIEQEQPKQVKQRLRGDADYRMDGIHAEESQIKMLNFGAKLIQEVYKIRDDSQGGLNLLTPLKDIITGNVIAYPKHNF